MVCFVLLNLATIIWHPGPNVMDARDMAGFPLTAWITSPCGNVGVFLPMNLIADAIIAVASSVGAAAAACWIDRRLFRRADSQASPS